MKMDRRYRLGIFSLFVIFGTSVIVTTYRTKIALDGNRAYGRISSDTSYVSANAGYLADVVKQSRIGSFDAFRMPRLQVKKDSTIGFGASSKEQEEQGEQFTQFLNILPADCSVQCMPTLDDARAVCDGKIMNCYECDSYERPYHEPHLFRNANRQSALERSRSRATSSRMAPFYSMRNPRVPSVASASASENQRGFICVHISKSTLDSQTASGPSFQSALSLPGPCDFRTRSTFFSGTTLFTSRCTCVGETESWENPMFVHPSLDECILSVLQPVSELANMCHNGTIKHISDMVKADIHACTKCQGTYNINEYGYSVCSL